MRIKTDEKFKLNNNYRAYYTRLIREVRPDLGEMLTSRESKADEQDVKVRLPDTGAEVWASGTQKAMPFST